MDRKKEGFYFEEDKHEYWLGNRKLPPVTHIVGNVLGSPNFATEWHLNRGTQTHKCISLYLRQQLDESSIDPRIQNRFNQAKKAIRELGIQPLLVELPMVHKILGFAGTPDLLTAEGILIDWKNSSMANSQPQGGGYIILLENQGYKVKKYYEIVLSDKKYILNEYKPARCKGLFLACLTIYQFKKNGK